MYIGIKIDFYMNPNNSRSSIKCRSKYLKVSARILGSTVLGVPVKVLEQFEDNKEVKIEVNKTKDEAAKNFDGIKIDYYNKPTKMRDYVVSRSSLQNMAVYKINEPGYLGAFALSLNIEACFLYDRVLARDINVYANESRSLFF
ncbi:MAG TPA: hypothetical protein VIL24_02205 [Clostridia bacterium]